METVVKKILASGSKAWNESPLPSYPQGVPEVVVCRISIAPGAKLERHSHPVINAGMVLSGVLTVVAADGTEKSFGPGEAIIEMVSQPHYGENRGLVPVDLVMFYASTPGQPLSLPAD